MRTDGALQGLTASGGLSFLGDGIALVAQVVWLHQVVLLQKIEKRSQLQPWDVGPSAAELHVLKQAKQ